jgi:hypothetical protein
MTTVLSSIILGDPKQATFTFPSFPEVLIHPILGCLLKYSISFPSMMTLLFFKWEVVHFVKAMPFKMATETSHRLYPERRRGTLVLKQLDD